MKIKYIPANETPKRIAIISDMHISKERSSNLEIFQKGITEINKIKGLDFIIHLGDLTHDESFLNYEYTLECLQSIDKVKFLIIPGNYDTQNVGYLLFENFFGSCCFIIKDKNLFMYGIDSSIPDLDPIRIGKRAIKKAREFFLSNSAKIKICCFHH